MNKHITLTHTATGELGYVSSPQMNQGPGGNPHRDVGTLCQLRNPLPVRFTPEDKVETEKHKNHLFLQGSHWNFPGKLVQTWGAGSPILFPALQKLKSLGSLQYCWKIWGPPLRQDNKNLVYRVKRKKLSWILIPHFRHPKLSNCYYSLRRQETFGSCVVEMRCGGVLIISRGFKFSGNKSKTGEGST